jgi:hypothetical protein
LKRPDAGLAAAQNQRVYVVGAFIGVHAFQLERMMYHAVVKQAGDAQRTLAPQRYFGLHVGEFEKSAMRVVRD